MTAREQQARMREKQQEGDENQLVVFSTYKWMTSGKSFYLYNLHSWL